MLAYLLVFRRVCVGGACTQEEEKKKRKGKVKLGKELRKQRANKKSLADFRSCI